MLLSKERMREEMQGKKNNKSNKENGRWRLEEKQKMVGRELKC